MLTCTVHDLGELSNYVYVATVSLYQGGVLLSRKRGADTWETQGGHIEPGETPPAAARRELYEEAGALGFSIHPLCDYAAAGTNGVCFVAHIQSLGPLPAAFEMEETRVFKALPENLTYPGITPRLVARARAAHRE